MQRKQYSSDLLAVDWCRLQPLLAGCRTGRWAPLEIINGILYQLKNNCLWQDLPADFPPCQTVSYYLKKWQANGTWPLIEAWLLAYFGESNYARKYRRSNRIRPAAPVVDRRWSHPAARHLAQSPQQSVA